MSVLGFQAPLSSRAGHIYFEEDPRIEQEIIAKFNLRKVQQGSPEFESISTQVAEKPKALWGVSGTPAELKLKDGGQLDYLYLLKTMEGRTYLFAQYAYG